MINEGMFTSKTDMWETPWDFYNTYDAKYHFETDVCATERNAKAMKFYTPEMNGLAQEWTGVCWMNPPYGRKIAEWVRKAYESARDNGATIVCLLPARTDTAWWHDYIKPYASSIEFVRGRIKFGGGKVERAFPERGCSV